MAISPTNLIFRSRRRIRVLFSNTLGAGAFNASLYTVTATDSLGTDPEVSAALIVGDSPAAVELALSVELADGAGYAVNIAAGVPAADASVTAAPVDLPLRTPAPPAQVAERSQTTVAIDRLYGVDIAFNGTDFVEGPDGDLQSVRAEENVRSALERRALSEGLAWRPDYGVRARQYVDGPEASAGALRADLVRQMRADDRVIAASARQTAQTGVSSEFIYEVDAELVGRRKVSTSVSVPRS